MWNNSEYEEAEESARTHTVFCLLNWLPWSSTQNNKEGLFSTIARNHALAGFKTVIYPAVRPRPEQTGESLTRVLRRDHDLDGLDLRIELPCKRYSIWQFLLAFRLLSQHLGMPNVIRNAFTISKTLWPLTGALSEFQRRSISKTMPVLLSALHGAGVSGVLAFLLHSRFGVPYILFERRTEYGRGAVQSGIANLYRLVLERAEIVLPVSPQLLSNIESFLGRPMSHAEVFPDPIPNAAFFADPSCEQTRFRRSFGFVFGGWTWWRSFKRLDLLLDAFAEVRSTRNDVYLVVAGKVDNAERIIQLIHELGIGEAVTMLGTQRREEVYCLARQVDCCVIPSDHETFGLPAIEAMAAGTPVVTTVCGGPESIITDPSLGLTVERSNAAALAEGMIQAMDYPFDPAHLRRTCRRRYSDEVLSRRLADVLSKAIG